MSHGKLLAENTAILEHVDLVLTIASSKIRSGNNDKAGKLVQLAQRATREVGKKITKQSKRMSGLPMSRVAVNQHSMEVHNQRLGIWKRITKHGETAVQQLEGYVHLIEKDEKENSSNKRVGETTSNQSNTNKDLSEMSPLKKKCDMKQTPRKPAKSTNNEDDNDEEDSCTECRQLFQHDVGQGIEMDKQDSTINPWPEVMLSPQVEAIIAEQKELRYTGPDLLPPNEPLFQGFASPPWPENHAVNEYSPKEAGTYLNCLDQGVPRGSSGNKRWICLEKYWHKVGLLTRGKTAVHWACKKVKEGKPVNDWWGESGRPSLLPISKLTEMAGKHVSNSHGLGMKPQDVIDAAARHQTDLAVARRVVPEMSAATTKMMSAETAHQNLLKMRSLNE